MVATHQTFAEVMREIEQKNEQAQQMIDSWGGTIPSRDQQDTVKKINQEIQELEAQAVQFKEGDELRQQVADRRQRLRTPVDTVGFGDGKHPGKQETYESVGDLFVSQQAIKDWQRSIQSASGNVSEKQRFQSPVVQLPGRKELKSLITGTSDTSAGALMRTDYQPLVSFPFRPLTVLDVITVGRTGSDLVSFPRVTSQTNNAAPTAEATAASGGSGVKPESDLALEIDTEDVKTIAHWIPATKRALADADQIRTYIDGFLMYGLEEELEDQIVAGSGSGENFTGLLNVTGTTTQAFATDILTTTRKAITAAKVTGRASRVNAWLMHPNDWEDFDLLQDNEARYYYGGPSQIGTPRLWGVPVVETEAVTEGFALVGDLRQAVLWIRENASIQVSDSHSDFFIRNLVAILAEMRAAFGVLRPAAIVEVDLTA